MAKQIKLYPPGGGEPIIPHKSDIEYLKSQGWTENEKKVSKPQPEKSEGVNNG